PGVGGQGLERARPGTQAVVDGQAREPGLPGDRADVQLRGVTAGHELAGRGQDRARRLVDRRLAAAQAIRAPLHPINLTYCLLMETGGGPSAGAALGGGSTTYHRTL